jgi:hypothetical protein
MPQFDYAEAVLVNGQIAESGPRVIDSYLNALVAQESDVDFAGFLGGNHTVRITGEEGVFDATGSGGSTTALIDALIAAFGDELLNIATLANNDPAMEIRFIHPDRVYGISFPLNPNANMSHNLVQAAGGTRIPLAVVVVQGANDDEANQPSGGSTSANALGVTVRNTDSDVNTGDPVVNDGFPAGSTLSVMKQGVMAGEVEDTVAAHGNVFFRIANPAAGQNLGGLRGDVAGGDAVQLLGAKFKTSTTGSGLAKVQLNMPATA